MNKIAEIREKLAAAGLDGLLITDEKNQRYAAGFPLPTGPCWWAGRRPGSSPIPGISRRRRRLRERPSRCSSDRQLPLKELLRRDIKEAGMERLAAEDGKLSHREYLEYEKALGLKLEPCGSLLQELRASKSEEELRYMQQAQDIAELALEDVLHVIKPGMTEQQVMAELVYSMLRHGSEGNSFDPIVVTGEKTSMPHGVPGDKAIRAGDFVTMDFGCIKEGYCSDMTRTVAVGHATEEMKTVYDIVLKAQLAGIAAARAGIPGRDIDAAARAGDKRRRLRGLFRPRLWPQPGPGYPREPQRKSLGPGPDAGGSRVLRRTGGYLPGRFGVRIEDVMVLKKDGCRLLTKAKKELIILPA
ncbi:MAG: Xaa-Pro peptidase family protein [Oscillospiraceae bacterium]